MKKLPVILCACTILAGCGGSKTDFDEAAAIRAEKRDIYRSEYGCSFTDDHAAYRQCLLNTHYASHPKTFDATRNSDGQSVAVIRSDNTKSSYNAETGTYKTERVIVIETEEHLEPGVAIAANIPYTVEPLKAGEKSNKSQKKQADDAELDLLMEEEENDVTGAEEAWKDADNLKGSTIEPVEPTPSLSTTTATETAQTKVEKKETWWDTYQKDKPEMTEEPQCPCPDPNEPCPQCVDK